MSSEDPRRLLDVGPQVAEAASLVSVSPHPNSVAYDPAQEREKLRGHLARALIYTLVSIVGCSFLIAIVTNVACAVSACTVETTKLTTLKSLLDIVFTPMVGLVGAVTGFYFGEKSGKAA